MEHFFEYEKCVYISVWDKNRIILNHFSLRSFFLALRQKFVVDLKYTG